MVRNRREYGIGDFVFIAFTTKKLIDWVGAQILDQQHHEVIQVKL
jgi:hypothetical protein